MPGKPMAEYEYQTTLAPGGEPIKITYSGEVEPISKRDCDMGRFPAVIEGKIALTDWFGKEKTQPFGRACWLGPAGRFHSVAISEFTTPIQNPEPSQNPR